MKKILLFLVCSSFFCGKCEKDIPAVGTSPEFFNRVEIVLFPIKDPRVNTRKLTLKNLDGIQPQFNINSTIHGGEKVNPNNYHSGEEWSDLLFRKVNNFKRIVIYFKPPDDADEKLELSLGKKRIYEMKLYLNDKLFFTKKISFTPKRYTEGPLLESMRPAHKTEVDDMKYVLRIEQYGFYINSYSCKILITDDDVKKWLDKNP